MRLKSLAILSLSILLPMQSYAAEKLIFAMDIVRHGDRTPTRTIPTAKYEWKEGLGQLTTIGMQQEYELGQAMRQRYVEKEHLLPAEYKQGTMYVRSTDYERTLMSAESLLMGLYPSTSNKDLPFGMQPIPVHTAPSDVDTIITHHIDPKVYYDLMKKYVYSTPEWKQKEIELQPYFQHWSTATGIQINKLEDVDIGDALYIHKLHNVPLPPDLTEDDINKIIDADHFTFLMEHKSLEVSSYFSKQLVDYITATLREVANNEDNKLKYVLLSAHDSTILSVLTVLGAPPAQVVPHYASDLTFALYEKGKRNYVLRVTYDGTQMELPACGGTECTLTQFANAAKHANRVYG